MPEPFYADDAVRALLDPRAPASSGAIRLIQVAMSGFGYDFYDARNVARSNDQLVRERTSDVLGEASAGLVRFERAYRARNVPAATREHPIPPADALQRLRDIDALRKRCEGVATALHTAETPATDAIWFRFRNEEALLHRLVAFDVELAARSTGVRDAILALDPATVDDAALAAVDAGLAALEGAFARRSALLKGG